MRTPNLPPPDLGGLVARFAVVVIVIALFGFALSTYAIPSGFTSMAGTNRSGLAAWRSSEFLGFLPFLRHFGTSPPLSTHLPAVSLGTFLAYSLVSLRVCLATAVGAYGVLCVAALSGARLSRAWTWPLALPVAVAFAFVMPPMLSTDAFAYVGYARLWTIHDLNPHVQTQADLIRLGDLSTPYLRWPIASPYGPLWTLATIGLHKLVLSTSLPGAVLVLKLVSVAALMSMSAIVAALTTMIAPATAAATGPRPRGTPQQLKRPTAFALIAFNPLLLIEGPGNAHNDLVMMAFVLLAARSWRSGALLRAALFVGIASAIKFIPLLLLPALVLSVATTGSRTAIARCFAVVAIGLLPLVVSYAPFWEGTATFNGIAARWGHSASSAAPSTTLPVQSLLVLTVYLGCLVRVFRIYRDRKCLHQATERSTPSDPISDAWTWTALSVLLFASGVWFPWYLTWIWPAGIAMLLGSPDTAAAVAPALSSVTSAVTSVAPFDTRHRIAHDTPGWRMVTTLVLLAFTGLLLSTHARAPL